MAKNLIPTSSGAPDPAGVAIAAAALHAGEAARHLSSACQHALLAGARLLWLHGQTEAQGARNDLLRNNFVSRETKLGFADALEKIGLSRPTAYRWLNAAAHALRASGFDPDALPEQGTEDWLGMEEALREAGAGTTLRRLQMGFAAAGSDPHRAEDLILRAEAGDELADEFIGKVDAGEMTWVQAIRAGAGAEAARGKGRKDPVYLDIDPATGKALGLFPRALVTLKNAFSRWDELDAPTRKQARLLWLETVAGLPADFRAPAPRG